MDKGEFIAIEWDGSAICYYAPSIDEDEVLRRLNAYTDLLEALEDLFALMEEGQLVRDTSEDNLDSYWTKSMEFVKRIHKAQQAIEKAKGE